MFVPNRLALFALHGADGQPLSRLTFYAEIVSPTPQPEPPPPAVVDHRFDDFLLLDLKQIEPALSATVRNREMRAAQIALTRALAPDTLDVLNADADAAMAFLDAVLQTVRQIGGGSFRTMQEPALTRTMEKAVRAEARTRRLTVIPLPDPALQARSAHPLGVLATDHAGYLSFDLTRLPPAVRQSLAEAVEARRLDPDAVPDTAAWLYLLGRESSRFDVLAQGRFTGDTILCKLEFDTRPPAIAAALAGGFAAMQNPGLSDWRLSAASFAANPAALLGDEDGCEKLLPAHVALQEFRFRQVVRLSDVAPLAAGVRAGVVHEYALSWQPLGHSLGQLLYSLPLAPGESVNLAVVDWSRHDDARRQEQTGLDEKLVNDEHRDRTISETVSSALQEYQHGSSFMGGVAASAGGSASTGVYGGAAGISGSVGGSTASSDGSRNLAGDTVQKISDHITQASAAQRELRSTVVVHSVQAESEAVQTRTVVNYNHSHTLTVLYYEVLRHFRVETRLVRRTPALLVQNEVKAFETAGAANGAPLRQASALLLDNRALLRASLLDPGLAPGFDALDRIRARPPRPAAAPPPPYDPGTQEFVLFTITVHVNGIGDNAVALLATLFDGPNPLVALVTTTDNVQHGDVHQLQSAGDFEKPDRDYIVFGVTEDRQPRQWKQIRAISVRFAGVDSGRKFSVGRITVTGSDMRGRIETLIDWDARDYIFSDDTSLLLETTHPPAATPAPATAAEELSDQSALEALLDHLASHKDYYNRVIWLGEDPQVRAARLDQIAFAGSSLLDHLDNRPLDILGTWTAFPSVDAAVMQVVDALPPIDDSPDARATWDERLVTLPTRGVFADAKLGHCNASEVIDNTRFWDWQTSPIPHYAPEIAPTQTVTPQPQQQDLQPTAFPSSLVNIVNPAPAPDPTGLAAAMGVMATPNIFRDMSGQSEVADLLKRLSDNSVGIAEASSIARSLTGGSRNPTGTGYGLGTASGTTPGLGGSRATPAQPSAVNRDLQDRGSVLRQAVRDGLMTPEDAAQAFRDSVSSAGGDLQQVQQTYARPAYTASQIAGIAGEVIAARSLRSAGHIVFSDPSKHVSATGLDMVSLLAAEQEADDWVWLVDNKAQFSGSGIGGASALTGDAFDTYLANTRRYLTDVAADQLNGQRAVRAIDAGRYRRVVSNGFAGEATRFTKGLFARGLHAYDIRLGALYGPGEQAIWEAAFKALSLNKAARVIGKSSLAFEGMFLALAVSGGVSYMMRSGADLKAIAGEVVTQLAVDTLISRLPGGFFASLVLGLESDNPAEIARQKLEESVDAVFYTLPGAETMPEADKQATRDAIRTVIQNPIDVGEPPDSRRPSLPGFVFPHEGNDWA